MSVYSDSGFLVFIEIVSNLTARDVQQNLAIDFFWLGRWFGRWPVAGGRWPVGRWPEAGGRWPVAGGWWPVAVAGGRRPVAVAGGRWPGAGGRRPVAGVVYVSSSLLNLHLFLQHGSFQ